MSANAEIIAELRRVLNERDEARAEAKRLSESAKAAWEAECVMRDQRDRYHAEWKQERQEVERLRETKDYLRTWLSSEELEGLRVKAAEHPLLWEEIHHLKSELEHAYRRGAEAMREACAVALMSDGLVLSRERAANVVRALPIPEEP